MSATAVLVGGPFDGHRDTLAPGEPPELVTLSFCHECGREHLFAVTGDPWPADVYLRDGAANEACRVLYRHVDVDEDLDDFEAEQHVLDGHTGAL